MIATTQRLSKAWSRPVGASRRTAQRHSGTAAQRQVGAVAMLMPWRITRPCQRSIEEAGDGAAEGSSTGKDMMHDGCVAAAPTRTGMCV